MNWPVILLSILLRKMSRLVVSVCGAGDIKDPEHLRSCMLCNGGAWRDYRRRNPLFKRLKAWFATRNNGLSIPPDV